MVEQSLKTWFRNGKPASILTFLVKLIIIGLLAWSFGWWFVPYMTRLFISSKLVISPELSPEYYAAWEKPPMPIFFKAFLFNVTNPDEIQAGGLPKFVEVGPYVFQGKRWRQNVSFDDATDTATYNDRAHFHFNNDLSGNKTLDDVVTIINVPFAAAAIKIQRDFPWPLRHVALTILKSYEEPLFIQKRVEEILFKGWKVPFLQKIEEEIGLTMLKNNTFGFFVGLNDTNYGPTTIKRGIHGDKSDFGKVVKFKGETTLNFWGDRSTFCNKIDGTDGTIFPPFMQKDTVLRAFNGEICRSVYLLYHNDTVFEGIPGYRFIAPNSVNEDPRVSEENRCFCETVESDPGKCLGRGALDMGPCRDGAPVAMTPPHFLGADPKYMEQISEGMKPDRDLHESFIDIEPLTGVTLEAKKKVQLALILKRVSSISSLRKVNDMLFPLFWAEESGKLGGDELELFKFYFSMHLLVDSGSKYGAVVVAIIAIIVVTRQHFKVDSKTVTYTTENGNDTESSDKFLEE